MSHFAGYDGAELYDVGGYDQPTTGTSMPAVTFQVAFFGTRGGQTVSADPNDPTVTPTWTDLSSRLVQISVKRGKSYELDEAQAQEYQLKITNTDGALDPTNTDSPYYPYVLPFRAFRLQVTIAGTPYTACTGYIESWPQTWELHGTYAYVTATATDALATLSQIILPSALTAEILEDNPVGYWPLTEPNGAVIGANITANAAVPPMIQVQYGTGGAVGFGNTTLTTLIGAGGSSSQAGTPVQGDTTAVYLANPDTPTGNGNGIDLESHFGTTYNGGTNGVTLECWFQSLAGHSYANSAIIMSIDGWTMWASGAGPGYLGVVAGDMGDECQSSTANILDGKLHHLVATVQGGGNMIVYVDGSVQHTNPDTNPANLFGISKCLVGYPSSTSWAWQPIALSPFSIAHVAVYDQVLPPSRISAHYNIGINAATGEDTGARFSRILRYAAWNGQSVVPTGNNNMLGIYDCANKSALAALLDVCTAEQGNMYIDNLGRVVFENRHARMIQNTQAYVLGENTAAGEIPYQGDIQIDFDPQQVYNTAIIERPGGIVLNTNDPASILRYFPRAFPKSPLQLPVADDQTAIDTAQFLLGRYKDAHARVQNVKISPTGNPAAWPFALSVQIGQRVGLNRRTPSAPTVNLDLFVESIGHDYDAKTGVWETSLELSPAFWQNYVLMTAARGTLQLAIAAGATTFNVLISGDTAGNPPEAQGWNAGVITSVQIVDGAHTETLTVTSLIPHDVGGWTGVVLTTTATTYAHAAGVIVAENPGAYTYDQFDPSANFDGIHQLAY